MGDILRLSAYRAVFLVLIGVRIKVLPLVRFGHFCTAVAGIGMVDIRLFHSLFHIAPVRLDEAPAAFVTIAGVAFGGGILVLPAAFMFIHQSDGAWQGRFARQLNDAAAAVLEGTIIIQNGSQIHIGRNAIGEAAKSVEPQTAAIRNLKHPPIGEAEGGVSLKIHIVFTSLGNDNVTAGRGATSDPDFPILRG